ncbi:serine/threonine-protein kinase [Cesiribacter andamanensis]|uniref:non-specific serine/threonine protein kinase n=1 Tax=Cesiribacter andamanensis AMV16 TaxID=1279009 RepID=M7NGH5_9BACT|nr:serine/threonine-protein kinase [Cesiribacter andamanensis]EMR00935.1 Serine/threonine-protein kinase PrkC [Cesiribacter andamanensis AMV16]
MPVLKQNEIFAGRYLLSHFLGEGGFSEVWKALDLMADDAVVAIKIYAPTKGLDDYGLRQFRNEFTLTHSLSHPHLLRVHHYDIVEGSPYLIMPYCPYGSLTTVLREQGVLSERQLALVMRQIGSALAEIHGQEAPIIHQDIKPDNILLLQPEVFMLADFGISNRIRNTIQLDTSGTQTLTVAYAPPERFDRRPSSDTSGDIFSLGVTLYEMCTDTIPWEGAGGQCLLKGAAVPVLPDRYAPELSAILEACMQADRRRRPTARQLHQWGKHYLETGRWEIPAGLASGAEPAQAPQFLAGPLTTAPAPKPEPLRQPTPAKAAPLRTVPPGIRRQTAPKRTRMPSVVAALVALALLAGAGYWVYHELLKKGVIAAPTERTAASLGQEPEPAPDPLQDKLKNMEAELQQANQRLSWQDSISRLQAREKILLEARQEEKQNASAVPSQPQAEAATPVVRTPGIRQQLQKELNQISNPQNSREQRSGWKQEALARFADGSVRVLDESDGSVQEYRAGIFLTMLLTSPHQVTVREVKTDQNNKITELRVSKDPIAAF